MPTDLLDQISAINPLPEDVAAPPIASLPTLPAPPVSDPSPGPTRARPPFPRRTLLAAPIAVVVLGLALLGRGGGRFDVAAAVYKATLAGTGVHFMFLEGEAGPMRIRYRRWSTTDPRSERSVQSNGSRLVELVSGGGVESAWSTEHPRRILRVHRSGQVSRWDPVLVIQQAYRAGRLHVLGKTTVGARAAYRTQVVSGHGASGPIVIVDAHTFAPIEMVYRAPHSSAPDARAARALL